MILCRWVSSRILLRLPDSANTGITILWNSGNYLPSDMVSHPQGLKSWATPLWALQILWGDSDCDRGDSYSRVWRWGSSGTQMFKRYQCFRENCASIVSVKYVTPKHPYSSTTLQDFASQKSAILTDWWSLRTRCWEMQLILGQAWHTHILLHAYLLQTLAMEAANRECRPLTGLQHYPRQTSVAAYVHVDFSASWRGGV